MGSLQPSPRYTCLDSALSSALRIDMSINAGWFCQEIHHDRKSQIVKHQLKGWRDFYSFSAHKTPTYTLTDMTISRKSLAALLPLYMALVVSASPLNLKVRQDGGQTAPDGQPTDAVPTENSSSTNTVYPTEAAGAPAPTSTQPGSLASDWLYQGCFEDTMERLLKGFYIESNAMTRDKCFASCQSQNLPVAGLEDGEYHDRQRTR